MSLDIFTLGIIIFTILSGVIGIGYALRKALKYVYLRYNPSYDFLDFVGVIAVGLFLFIVTIYSIGFSAELLGLSLGHPW